MGPYKCPDCGVWWSGFEHRCRPTVPDTQTKPPVIPEYPRPPWPGTLPWPPAKPFKVWY